MISPTQKKNGYALLVSLVACLFFGIFIALSFMRSSSLTMRGTVSRNAEDALYAAETGLQHALDSLRYNGLSWAGTNGVQTIQNNGVTYGSYQTIVNNITTSGVWNLLSLTVTGQNASQTATRVIQAIVREQSPANFFILSISDLTLGAGASIGSNLAARNVALASLQANQTITVNGTVQYFNNLSGYDPNNTNIIITGTPKTELIDPPPFPGIDDLHYQNLAATEGYLHSGNLIIANGGGGVIDRNNFAGNNTTQNGIIYVNGDVYISGSVAQSMTIVATGNIHVAGNLEYNNPNDPTIQLGLFSQNDIIIDPVGAGQNLNLQAYLKAEHRIIANGTFGSQGTLNFKGAMSVRGDVLTNTAAIDLGAFANRNYVYHSELGTQCTIPGMTFMADVQEWSVVGNPAAAIDS